MKMLMGGPLILENKSQYAKDRPLGWDSKQARFTSPRGSQREKAQPEGGLQRGGRGAHHGGHRGAGSPHFASWHLPSGTHAGQAEVVSLTAVSLNVPFNMRRSSPERVDLFHCSSLLANSNGIRELRIR